MFFSKSSLEELEEKHSQLRRELVTVKENLNQITLQKEVLEEDKASLSLAVSKVNTVSSPIVSRNPVLCPMSAHSQLLIQNLI